jgi:hypothetical protein
VPIVNRTQSLVLSFFLMVAFLAGVLRVPVAILQLTGVLRASVPSWYVVFQGLRACQVRSRP